MVLIFFLGGNFPETNPLNMGSVAVTSVSVDWLLVLPEGPPFLPVAGVGPRDRPVYPLVLQQFAMEIHRLL